jgi:hypothetical protein
MDYQEVPSRKATSWKGPMKRTFRECAAVAALFAFVGCLVIFYHLSGLAVWVAGFVPLD